MLVGVVVAVEVAVGVVGVVGVVAVVQIVQVALVVQVVQVLQQRYKLFQQLPDHPVQVNMEVMVARTQIQPQQRLQQLL